MENIKVTIIHPSDPLGPKAGGAEAFIKGFIKYAPENLDVELIGISSDEKERVPGRWMHISLGDKPLRFYPLFFCKDENKKSLIPLSLSFAIKLRSQKIKPLGQVILFNRIEPAILYRDFKVPKLLIMHTDRLRMLQKGSEVVWGKIPGLYSVFERKVFSFLTHIYCVSENSIKFYLAEYPKEKYKFSLLPTFFDSEIFYPVSEPKENVRKNIVKENKKLPLSGKWVLFVGRLQEAKAPLRLVRTFGEYYKMNKESCLLIIGVGDLEQKTRFQVEKLGISRAVHFLGPKNSREIAAYYRAADVMMLTSNFEGLPISALESLACGSPVVSTDVGEIKKVVRSGFSGEVVNSFDPSEIARALAHVVANPYIYSKDNCTSSVAEYTPQKVLVPLFENLRDLCSASQMKSLDFVEICGVKINNVTMNGVVRVVENLIRNKEYGYLLTPNVDHIIKLQKDEEFQKIYRGASLVLPDGMPLLWAAKFLGTSLREKISGSDLFPKLCEVADEKGYKVFFLGGREGAALKAAEILKTQHPGLQIVGFYSPIFGFEKNDAENGKIVGMIKEAKPDILFVGLGAPKQEKWIYKYKDQYQVPVSIGVGVSFEFVAGIVKRAPLWMQKTGLEWFWRLMMEPRRLWKRYLVDDLKFFWLVLRQKRVR